MQPTSVTSHKLVIATRKSALAIWQANHVKSRLEKLHRGLQVELLGMTTQGDKILDVPLAKIGGKGLFVKELEQALLDGRADLAVHSIKDVPMAFPKGLTLPIIMERETPTDAFVSNGYANLDACPERAIVGTSSLRRQAQLAARYPHIRIRSLRGNVNTRLKKLDAGEYDAIILASAGLQRLGFSDRIRQELTPEQCLPAVGQGALGLECRADDSRVQAMLEPLLDLNSAICVRAERAMNKQLQGGCQVPIAGYAELIDNRLQLRGLVAGTDGKTLLTSQMQGSAKLPEALGIAVAEDLLAQGAGEILSQIYG